MPPHVEVRAAAIVSVEAGATADARIACLSDAAAGATFVAIVVGGTRVIAAVSRTTAPRTKLHILADMYEAAASEGRAAMRPGGGGGREDRAVAARARAAAAALFASTASAREIGRPMQRRRALRRRTFQDRGPTQAAPFNSGAGAAPCEWGFGRSGGCSSLNKPARPKMTCVAAASAMSSAAPRRQQCGSPCRLRLRLLMLPLPASLCLPLPQLLVFSGRLLEEKWGIPEATGASRKGRRRG
jgi:hypothetical protein